MDNNQYENIDSKEDGSGEKKNVVPENAGEEVTEDTTEEINEETAEDSTRETAEDATRETAEDATVEPAVDVPMETAEDATEQPKGSPLYRVFSSLYDYIEIFALSIVAVIFIFSFCVRLCRVDGSSMNNTLCHGERIVVSDLFYTPSQGDIIVFHLSNDSYHEPLVKRVIATEGQTLEINFTKCEIRVDGVLFPDEDAYISGGHYEIRYDFNKEHIVTEGGMVYYRATVPEGKVFVMGDNRNGSSDSRSSRIGFVDENCILGKAILRLKPFTLLGE